MINKIFLIVLSNAKMKIQLIHYMILNLSILIVNKIVRPSIFLSILYKKIEQTFALKNLLYHNMKHKKVLKYIKIT